MSNDRKYLYRRKKDHILRIVDPEGFTVDSDPMSNEDASELFSWFSSYFPTAETTLIQLIPSQFDERPTWQQPYGGGPTVHLADALQEDDNEQEL